MSRDGTYILKYDTQDYVKPTPMELDKKVILELSPASDFKDFMYGWTVVVELGKYTIPDTVIEKLKADQIFESCDGDDFVQLRPTH